MKHGSTSIAMHVLGAVSGIGSLFMIVALLRDRNMKITLYSRVVLYMACCDFIGAISYSFGLVKDRSPLCWVQAIMTNVFPVAGIFWTTILAYLLFSVISTGKMMKELSLGIHLFCFVLPIILTLLPLSTNRYGARGDYGWCFIDNRSDSPEWSQTFWVIASFYLWIWIAIILFIALYAFIIWRLQLVRNEMVKMSVNNIIWYPLAVVVCWCLPTIYDITYSLDKSRTMRENGVFFNFSFLSPMFQGTLNTIIFFTTNENARDVLRQFLWSMPCLGRSRADDEDASSVVVTTVISPPFAVASDNGKLQGSTQGGLAGSDRSVDVEFSSVGRRLP